MRKKLKGNIIAMIFPLTSLLKTVASLEDKILLILKEVFTCNIAYFMAYLRD